jgi:hypothetical protein
MMDMMEVACKKVSESMAGRKDENRQYGISPETVTLEADLMKKHGQIAYE